MTRLSRQSRHARWLILLVILLLVLGIQLAAGQVDEPDAEAGMPTEGELFAPMTFRIPVDTSTYRNPFDTSDIELIGIFQSPTGDQQVIPGFWMQPYVNACESPCDGYDLQTEGEPVWEVRFTPQQVGDWSYTLQVRDNGSVVAVRDGEFVVTESDRRGFIRRGENRRYFQYENGEAYFPIGQNLKWSWTEAGGLETYDTWLRELSDAGGNYARLYIDVPWFINLEWTGSAGDYRTAQRSAAELDLVLQRAADYGVSLQLVLLWHQSLRTYTSPPVNLPEDVSRPDVSPDWDNHPYNVLNGGPLSGPSVFFFNEDATNLFRRRLRYIVARWGYSPQVFAWEIIDEIDRTANYNPDIAASWLRSTISYIRQIDQHGHLITASSREYDPVIAENPLLDFASAQFYQRRPIESVGDQVTSVLGLIQRHIAGDFAPVMLVDYSLNPWFEPTGDDPEGIHVQNTLWAAALSGASGGAMSDWWDSYIIPQGLMRYYAPLAAFTAGIDWPNLKLQPAEAGLLTDQVNEYLPVRLNGFRRQFAVGPETVVTRTITADGVFPALDDVPSFLYGQLYNTQFSQAQRYRVAPPVDTYLEVGIRAISTQADARLVVQIDNEMAIEVAAQAGNRNFAVRVPLLAGEHLITLDNMGDDWLELEYIEVGQLVAPARALTLRDGEAGVALAWLQHRDYTWENVADGVEITPILFDYQLGGMAAGRYVAEIWDPLNGTVLGEEILRVGDDGILRFELLPLDRQLAVRAIRQPDLPTATPTPLETDTSTPSPTVAPSSTFTVTPEPTEEPSATEPEATVTPASTSSPTRTRPAVTTTARATSLATLVPFVPGTNTPRPGVSPTSDSDSEITETPE
ncbi:MAG: hypothetical protein CL610_10030 [Anaerolineaceae bacterium]|nr:hypothetical protein [Anaerolineaceae bacterium]